MTKTIPNQLRNATFEISEAQKRLSKAAISKANDLSLKLYQLTEIVKLAAFSAEARRTLKGIENAKIYRPEIEKVIADAVTASNNWLEMEDATGNVLAYVARQLDEVNGDFTQNLYDLADAKAGNTETEKIGGVG